MYYKFSENKLFFILYCILFLFVLGLCLKTEKGSETLYCYNHYSTFYNYFFKTITHLGEFYLIAPIAIYIYTKNRPFLKFAAGAWILQHFIAQILKHYFNAPRPLTYFSETIDFQTIDGVAPLYHLSMPSGHTSMAFCSLCIVSFLSSNDFIKTCCIILATLVGVSRIYLICHFKEDALVGSLVGVFSASLMVYLYNHLRAKNSI